MGRPTHKPARQQHAGGATDKTHEPVHGEIVRVASALEPVDLVRNAVIAAVIPLLVVDPPRLAPRQTVQHDVGIAKLGLLQSMADTRTSAPGK